MTIDVLFAPVEREHRVAFDNLAALLQKTTAVPDKSWKLQPIFA